MQKVLAMIAMLSAGAAAQGIDWMTDLDAARALAKTKNRPLLAVFR